MEVTVTRRHGRATRLRRLTLAGGDDLAFLERPADGAGAVRELTSATDHTYPSMQIRAPRPTQIAGLTLACRGGGRVRSPKLCLLVLKFERSARDAPSEHRQQPAEEDRDKAPTLPVSLSLG